MCFISKEIRIFAGEKRLTIIESSLPFLNFSVFVTSSMQEIMNRCTFIWKMQMDALKYNLEPELKVDYNQGIKAKDLKKALVMIENYREEIVKSWKEHH